MIGPGGSVLVTGASGGFGRVLCARLARAGLRVFGTQRDPSGEPQTQECTWLAMEATDDASVQACIDRVVAEAGRIDAVVNCVNQMVIGSIEEQTADEVRALYDVNVFGVLRVCQAVAPVMRAQGHGTIVNMSSLGGVVAVPYMSAYTSAKFALEALSEAMYHELRPDGIDVVIMQPVAMKMDRAASGAHLRTVANVAPDSFSHAMMAQMARDTAESRLTPEAVADRVLGVLQSERKPLRVPMDRARVLGLVKRLVPQRVLDRLIAGLLRSAREHPA